MRARLGREETRLRGRDLSDKTEIAGSDATPQRKPVRRHLQGNDFEQRCEPRRNLRPWNQRRCMTAAVAGSDPTNLRANGEKIVGQRSIEGSRFRWGTENHGAKIAGKNLSW